MPALMVFTNVTSIKKVKERMQELKPGEDAKNEEWATGFYPPSFVYVYRSLEKEGFDITMCSPKGGKVTADPDGLELWDQPACINLLAKPEVVKAMENTKKVGEINAADYDIIHFVGGHGCYFDIATDPDVKTLVAEIYEKGGVVTANSDGVAGLLNVKLSNKEHLVKGKKITCLPTVEQGRLDCQADLPFILETELINQGADFKKGIPVKDHVLVSDRIVTGQNPNSAEPLSRCLAIEARKIMKIKRSVLYIMTNVSEFPDKKKTGSYAPSIVYPYRELRRARMLQTICTPNGGEAPVDPWSLELWDHPLVNNLLAEEQFSHDMKNTVPIKDVNPGEYNAVVFPGGYGGLFDLVDNAKVKEVVAHVYEKGGVVASNSHGAVGLLNVKLSNGEYLLNGKNVTALPKVEEDRLTMHQEEFIENFPIKLEEELKKQGADFKEGIPVKEHVESHQDRIITGQNPNSAEYIARRITKAITSTLR